MSPNVDDDARTSFHFTATFPLGGDDLAIRYVAAELNQVPLDRSLEQGRFLLPHRTSGALHFVCYHPAVGIRNYLIEGVSRTDKTSVCKELQRRGY